SVKELERLQGTWSFESYEEDGKPAPKEKLKGKKIFFGGNQFIVRHGDQLAQLGKQRLDPTDGARAIDLTVAAGPHKGKTLQGIYELKGDTFRVCIDTKEGERPKEFKTTPNSGRYLAVYKRDRPPGEEVEIVGNYKSENIDLSGEKQV